MRQQLIKTLKQAATGEKITSKSGFWSFAFNLDEVDRSKCESCMERAAFQVALAYETGFAVAKDDQEVKRYLEIAKKSRTQLMELVAQAAAEKPSAEYLIFNPSDSPSVVFNDGPRQYEKWGSAEEIRKILEWEIEGKKGSAVAHKAMPVLQHIRSEIPISNSNSAT